VRGLLSTDAKKHRLKMDCTKDEAHWVPAGGTGATGMRALFAVRLVSLHTLSPPFGARAGSSGSAPVGRTWPGMTRTRFP
jgi:hypothetical protein